MAVSVFGAETFDGADAAVSFMAGDVGVLVPMVANPRGTVVVLPYS